MKTALTKITTALDMIGTGIGIVFLLILLPFICFGAPANTDDDLFGYAIPGAIFWGFIIYYLTK